MTSGALSICYVAPGQNLLGSAGPTRNVLNLAEALGRRADVSVAFRRALSERQETSLPVLEIDPTLQIAPERARDDAAVRGVGVLEFVRYLRTLRRFIRRELVRFDLVLEKSWTLSGLVAEECRKLGVPGLVIENLVPVLGEATEGRAGWLKRPRLAAGRYLAGRYLRRSRRIIAETPMLKTAMVSHWGIPEGGISVVPLGVDRNLFRPLDQSESRLALGIDPRATVLLYSGIVDRTHNLGPAVRALCELRRPDVQLHVIGGGPLCETLEREAGSHPSALRLHGRVPYEQVPRYLAAADLCLAPYDPESFAGGEMAYSSLKIPEYLSVGRPVVSVPSGRVLDLVADGKTGFLFDNCDEAWRRFLSELPDRETLRVMGEAALRSRLDSWDDVAEAYLRLGRAEIARCKGAA